jgi:Holliday junction resolvase RusA-like endonuclease
MTVWRFTIYGNPAPKKTSPVLVRAGKRPVILPNKAWREWVRNAKGYPVEGMILGCCDYPCAIRALFYRRRNAGDLDNYLAGLGDLLQKHRYIANDKLIKSWDGSRLYVDTTNPRVEVTLTPFTEET